jgi:hypothetical protein
MSVEDLVLQAGGLLEAASTARVDVSRRIKNSKSTELSNIVGKTFSFELKDGFLVGGDQDFHLEPLTKYIFVVALLIINNKMLRLEARFYLVDVMRYQRRTNVLVI